MEQRREDLDRLLQLPQEDDVWQLGFYQWPDWITLACRAWHPWMMAVYSITNQTSLAGLLFHIDPPSDEFLRSLLMGAMANPLRPAAPHRPTELQFRDDGIGQALKPWVEQLGITCVLKDKMEEVQQAVVHVGEEFYGPRSAEPYPG